MSFTNQVDLSVLLQNTAKPAMDYIDRSSTKAIDISKLDVCFGGFTPMALSDGSDGIFLIGRQRLKPHIGRIADHHVERWIGRKPKKIRDDDIRGAP